jgi:ABC-type sugar transport system ATPase subunit
MTRDPEVYLFDDPLAGIDDDLKKAVLSDLVKVQARLNATFLYATDDIWQAVTLADRIAVLSEGKLVQVDTPQNLYAHPANELVAEIMGSTAAIDSAATDSVVADSTGDSAEEKAGE